MNDSSYDSLENELNEDVEAPCSDVIKKLRQGGRSMDSVLTLRDYYLDQPEVEETKSLQEKQEDMPVRAAEELEAVQEAQCSSSYPSQVSEKHFSSALNLVEDSLKLCMQSHGESWEVLFGHSALCEILSLPLD
ncbi:Rho GTPase-activating protein 20 [Pteropus alecto]|uniref:Rho GTPase-activating protein 20 n=1 Tax=Pteropus alecto TaxID=9402 RepID=L5L6X8_PTEAL|nr:Rho GTPase-activating protein 20 [Pteropus alecto]